MTNRIFIGDVVFYLAIGFLTGTLTAGLGWKLGAVCVAAVVISGAFLIATRKTALRVNAIISSICFTATIAGFFYYFLITNARAVAANVPIGQSGSFSVIIMGEPKISANYILLPAQAERPLVGELTIFVPLTSEYRYGDEVVVQGKIEAPKVAGETPAIFPKKKITLVAEHRGLWWREKLLEIKAAIFKKFGQFLAGDEAALVSGELFGGNDGMSAALKSEMSASGTSYVLSMYGYKMSLVIFLFEAMLAAWIGRRTRFALTGMAIVTLVALSGGNISAVRAAIMAVAALAAKLVGRVFNPRNALVLAAAGMALFDPALPAQPAFELSVLSVAGIFYLVEPLQNFFGWGEYASGKQGAQNANDENMLVHIFNWREAIVIATATLLPIIPIIAVAFGDFSLTAFPSNAFISFAILPTMILGIVIAISGFVAPPAAIVAAKIGQIILFYQFIVIRVFAAVAIPLLIPFAAPVFFISFYVVLVWVVYLFSG